MYLEVQMAHGFVLMKKFQIVGVEILEILLNGLLLYFS